MSSVKERYDHVVNEVALAAQRANRNPSDVRIVAVSKTVGVDVVGEAFASGITDFGENRSEVMAPKVAAFPEANWHFIGNIQARKVRDIVGVSCLIHSVDRLHIVERIAHQAEVLGMSQDILLEVNVSGEESKSGFKPDELPAALETCSKLPSLHVCGLMTMAPQADEQVVRATFRGLRELRDRQREHDWAGNVELNELSMGMSGDYPIAVEEGATIVRVGRSIFKEDFANL